MSIAMAHSAPGSRLSHISDFINPSPIEKEEEIVYCHQLRDEVEDENALYENEDSFSTSTSQSSYFENSDISLRSDFYFTEMIQAEIVDKE